MKKKNDYSREFFFGIQGNILQPHKRNHARHIFISFGKKQRKSKSIHSWIRHLALERLTSSWKEIETKQQGFFCSFLLSSAGYRVLSEPMPEDQAFRQGMKKRGVLINDSDSSVWDQVYNRTDIHGLLILADNDAVEVAKESVLIKENLIAAGGYVVAEEQGNRLARSDQTIEHFGFADGISQPKDVLCSPSTESEEVMVTDPKIVLVKETYGEGNYGSFLVFRKLEQNVRLWEENIRNLAKTIRTDPFLAGAFAIGRFKDGTPVIEHKEMQQSIDPNNEIDYGADPEGNRCPYGAHMRKMNTREDESVNGGLRIARRAMTYGIRPDLHPQGKMFPLPEKGVGLLFMCYQHDIAEGFERLQRIANNGSLPYDNSGIDPLISQGRSKKVTTNWPAGYDSQKRISFSFDRTVTLKGGEYFFAPSVKFLRDGIDSNKSLK